MKKSIFLFALLFLSFSTSLWADDDIVWMIKKKEYFGATLYNNGANIVTYDGKNTHYHYTETGEEFHTIPNANTLFFINEDTEFFQITNDRKYLVKYRTNDFVALDSISHDISKFHTNYNMSNGCLNLYELDAADSSKIRVWDIVQKKVVREMSIPINKRAGTKPETIAVHSNLTIQGVDCDNKRILVAQETEYELDNTPPMSEYVNTLAFYDVETSEKLYSLNNPGGRYVSSNTCKYLAKIHGNVELYDYKTMELITTIKGVDNASVRSLCFTNDDRYLIVTTMNSYIMQIWDLHNQKLIKTYDNTLPGVVLCITNDNQFAYCSIGNELYKLRLNIDSGSIGVEDTPTEEDNVPYPNPTNNKVNFEFNVKGSDVYNLKVVDLSGKEVLTKFIGNLNPGLNKVELEKSNLADGRYFVIIYSPSNTVRYNIVIGE